MCYSLLYNIVIKIFSLTKISKLITLHLISLQFPNRFVGFGQLESARKVDDMYSFIKSVKIWRRHVEVTHRTSPLLLLTMQHRSEVCKILNTI